jgi:hypothetical protein
MLVFDPFKSCPSFMFLTFGFYDSFLDERTKNMKDRDIMTMSKYPRKIDEVIDAMDFIVHQDKN